MQDPTSSSYINVKGSATSITTLETLIADLKSGKNVLASKTSTDTD